MHMRFYEYICIMHDGYARTMAIKWWSANVPMQHHFPINKEIDEIVALAKNYALRPARIKVKKNGKFWNICGYAFS